MRNEATSGKEASGSIDEQRARWEGANFRMTMCANGVVNVHNQNYGECNNPLAHIYSVRVEDGNAVGWSCPHATSCDAHCKHQRAVEQRPLVVPSATAAGATFAPVATDGGQPAESEETDDELTCDHCGTPPKLGSGFTENSNHPYCTEYSTLCMECVLEHGPDECEHERAEAPRTPPVLRGVRRHGQRSA
jgi:hypothetical protein